MWARARRALHITLWGRVAVAVGFVGFHAADLVGPRSRLLLLAPMLCLSAAWTWIEMRGLLPAKLRRWMLPAQG